MISYADALAAIDQLAPDHAVEDIPLAEAAGRVLASAVHLGGDQPPFDRATMDGYALRLQAGTASYRVVGTVHAGAAFAGRLAPGEAVRIMTGAPCPAGTTVVPHELTDRGQDTVTISDAGQLRPGRNIAWRGEDGRAGALVVPAGTRLAPVILAAAAMAGATRVSVSRPPRLAIITTGDELGAPGAARIADSNGPLLAALAASLGLTARLVSVGDDPGDLARLLAEVGDGPDGASIIVTTGGVSFGDRDAVPAAAAAAGFATIFHQIAMQPGKPVLLARRARSQFLLGLPGNPLAVLATAHLILLPLLARFLHAPAPPWLTLPAALPWHHPGSRQLFLHARLVAEGIAPQRGNGSGDLLAAAASDGLVELAAGAHIVPGQPLRFLPFIGGRIGERSALPERPAGRASPAPERAEPPGPTACG